LRAAAGSWGCRPSSSFDTLKCAFARRRTMRQSALPCAYGGRRLGLVPTGCLHEGTPSLLRAARSRAKSWRHRFCKPYPIGPRRFSEYPRRSRATGELLHVRVSICSRAFGGGDVPTGCCPYVSRRTSDRLCGRSGPGTSRSRNRRQQLFHVVQPKLRSRPKRCARWP